MQRIWVTRAKWVLLCIALISYLAITYHLAGSPPSNCPTLEELQNRVPSNQPMPPVSQSSAKDADFGRREAGHIQLPDSEVHARVNGPMGVPHQRTHSNAPTNKPSEGSIEFLSHDVILDPSLSPSTVYYVWCGKRWFEFNHYIAVKSVIRTMRPDNIVFYYDFYPVLDEWRYNTWMGELIDEYPFFRPRQLDPKERGCVDKGIADMFFVYGLLSTRGGIYVNEHTVFPQFPITLRKLDLVYGVTSDKQFSFVMSQRGLPGKYRLEDITKNQAWKSRVYNCVTMDPSTTMADMPFCLELPNRMFPKDIWRLDSAFGRLVRKIFYNDEKIPQPQKSYDELVPNIAHIVWIGGGEMDFLFYLCVLSLVYVVKVDVVYIHGDGPPTGHYWQIVQKNPKVKHIFRETPKTVYGNTVNVLSHITDVWRVDFMVKYGGIYVDTDTAFVRPLDREIRSYDAVATYDWTYWNHPFPDTINFGVSIGKRNATFWHRFQESMKWFIDNDWAWNGLRQPYRITERHPELALIDPRMQVTCYQYKCHPTWWPDYHNESVHHLNTPSIKDWRKDLYAFHWTLPTPPELLSEQNLVKSNTIFSEAAKFILKEAGHKLPN